MNVDTYSTMRPNINYKIHMLEYPTIGVSILGYIFWLSAIYLRLHYNFHYAITTPLSIMGVYTLFTPLHEAVHTNISNNRTLNNNIGNLVTIPFFFANFNTFKFIHLQHHRYTNIKDKDPDHFSRYGIIGCICMPIHYYIYVYQNKGIDSDVLYTICVYTLLYMGYVHDIFHHLLVLWIIPSIVAIMILSYVFDYLPHRDHTNIDQPTKMTDGILHTNNGHGNDVLSILTCNQLTYHHVHHLYSKIPFHAYKSVWTSNYEYLRDKYELQSIF